MGFKIPLVPAIAAVALLVILSVGGYLLFRPEGDGDGNGEEGPDTNRSPTANAGYDRTIYPGEDVALEGTLSSDPDGDSLTFIWDLDDSTDSDDDGDKANDADLTGEVVRHTYPEPEETKTYRIVLNVSDGEKSDTDTVQVTILVADDEDMPLVNMSCHYARPPNPIPGVQAQYVLTVDSVSRTEMLLNYSYVLLGPDSEIIEEGGLIELLASLPNATLRYIDTNPRYQDLSSGDSITAKDVEQVPEGSVLEIYFKSFPDPSGAVTLSKGTPDRTHMDTISRSVH